MYSDFEKLRIPHIVTICETSDNAVKDVINTYGKNYLQKIIDGINAASKRGETSFSLTINSVNGENTYIKTAIKTIRNLFIALQEEANEKYKTYQFKVKGTNNKNQNKTYNEDEDISNIIITSIEINWNDALINYRDGVDNFTLPATFNLLSSKTNEIITNTLEDPLILNNNESITLTVVYEGNVQPPHALIKTFYSTDEDKPIEVIETINQDNKKTISYKIIGHYLHKENHPNLTEDRDRILITFINNDGHKIEFLIKVNPN